jgi:hypothetical protein
MWWVGCAGEREEHLHFKLAPAHEVLRGLLLGGLHFVELPRLDEGQVLVLRHDALRLFFLPEPVVLRRLQCKNIQSVGIFQWKIFSQWGYFSKTYSVSRDIRVQHIQSVEISQYKLFNQ